MSSEPADFDDSTLDATIKMGDQLLVRQFGLTVESGPEAGTTWESITDRCSIGSHPSNDLVLTDPTVSRFHAEIVIGDDGARVRDIGSRNGTRVDGVRVADGWLRRGSRMTLGRSVLRFDVGSGRNRVPTSRRRAFGTLVGTSIAMRSVFAILEKVAPTEVTVLLEGETGTGKEEAAASIHEESPRRDGPFVPLNCGAVPSGLIESTLFGHEAGAFTDAVRTVPGVFEQARGGTLFLDELGELSPRAQAVLLRVLEHRAVTRVGGEASIPVDVRIVAATNRDLRREVSAGRFREDLYFRVSVVRVVLPPLRARPDDVPVLVRDILSKLIVPEPTRERLMSPEVLAQLGSAAWSGNVRELRNHLERCIALDAIEPVAGEGAPGRAESLVVDPSLPYAEARRRTLENFESAYAEALVRRHRGNVTSAASAAGIGRSYLHRLLRRRRADTEG